MATGLDHDDDSDADTATDGMSAPDIDDRVVLRSEVTPPPISGGTLALVDASHVIASDPDRDRVFIVAIEHGASASVVELESGDEPGRVVVDAQGLAHVALRGGSAIATIDPATATVIARHASCVNPRGLAIDEANARLWVACADGDLIEHELGGPMLARTHVVPDLRDVMLLQDGRIRVTRFRSAQVMDLDGGLPTYVTGPSLSGERSAATAWRTRMLANDGWVMVHQSHSRTPIETTVHDAYGGSSGDPCGPLVQTVVTTYHPIAGTRSTPAISSATLPVDVAVSPGGGRFAVAIAGQSDPDSPTMPQRTSVLLLPSDLPPDEGQCGHQPTSIVVDGQVTAVEFLSEDLVIAQSRERAGL
ncbi:MAG TPA: hypothetical protein VG755_35285, partial [Nannocystaceae bacterium]|nr:hypothetical protein [Nannocystaceae bacterium]